ncbi:DUF1488 domain-containing protein [Vibrio agarivorans]|uniref:DUF1488 domain-containing protein n=1 Tax=Vibrio agarivorans TaxID=153622 RepID=UPI002230EBFB|nr:DUF1488 domain-containing protein [Vibrio agarivorans]MDN3661940.1 DUF1488 domain-containing protein [Vibrio agarivorans]
MNQSILFPDIQTWDEKKQQVTFPVQQAGALIECAITKVRLEQLSQQTCDSELSTLEAFAQVRFDIEELIEEEIEEENFNSDGHIVLS